MSNHINLKDFSKDIQAIKTEYGEHYYKSKDAINKAAELWGFSCNEHGVVQDRETETLYDRNGVFAEVSFACSSKGYWNIGLNYGTNLGGGGYAPSVWDVMGFYSKEDARLFAIKKLIECFDHELRFSNTKKVEVERAIKQLKAEKTPQLDLFGGLTP